LGGNVEECGEALRLIRHHQPNLNVKLRAAIGIHPTNCLSSELIISTHKGRLLNGQEDVEGVSGCSPAEFMERAKQKYTVCTEVLERLEALITQSSSSSSTTGEDDVVCAVGEIGLDSEREHFCPLDAQAVGFEAQLVYLKTRFPELPIIFHLRGSNDDQAAEAPKVATDSSPKSAAGKLKAIDIFLYILSKHASLLHPASGVAHSFDGPVDDALSLVAAGLFIGINGCSLRSEYAFKKVVPSIPLDRIITETDSPYCDIRPSHACWRWD
jgi:Tat protein secretion system quality control protein TatD with DNase activity